MKEVSCSWPVATLLGQYCEARDIPFKIVKALNLDVNYFPLYYNDPVEGMCGEFLKKSDLPKSISEFKQTETYFITEDGKLRKNETFSDFIRRFAERYTDFKDDILGLEEIMKAIGAEWKTFTENGYKISSRQTPHLLKFYNKNFFDYIDDCQLPKELQRIFKSLFPKEDISFNNGAAYIVTQIFDSQCSLELSNLLISNSRFNEMCDNESNTNDDELLVLKVSQEEEGNHFVSFVGNCSVSESSISYFGLDALEMNGISQLILAEHNGKVQIDVYYNAKLEDKELLVFIGEFIDLSCYENLVAHRSAYFPGNWAFSAKEAMKNPFKKGQESLEHFGAAYFTAAIYEINEIEGAVIYDKNSN
jgi:hypothetical protein